MEGSTEMTSVSGSSWMSGPKETPIPRTPQDSPNIQKQSQPGLQEDLWWLDKSQNPLGTCEASSCVPKGVISFISGIRDTIHTNLWHFSAHQGPDSLSSCSQVLVLHLRASTPVSPPFLPPATPHLITQLFSLCCLCWGSPACGVGGRWGLQGWG